MVVYFFALFIIIHGIIHFMGFPKAFDFGPLEQSKKATIRPVGFFWLATCLLYLVAGTLLLMKKDAWSIIAIVAAIMSQALTIINWKATKFASIINLIILLVAIPSYANTRFNKMTTAESRTILARVAGENTVLVTKEMLASLPPVVQKWLVHSGVVGREKANTVRLKQKGELRTSSTGKWMPFEATQYFTVDEPAFVWTTKVKVLPSVNLTGRDKFENGYGQMTIKLLSLVNIAEAAGDEKTNASTMLRYLAEISWFPSAAISEYIKWEPIDAVSAKAIMSFRGIVVAGVFTFTKDGDMASFSADRYYGTGNAATLEKWLVQAETWKEFHGIRIANKNKVTWRLKTGDFNWANIEVTDLEFNRTEIYK